MVGDVRVDLGHVVRGAAAEGPGQRAEIVELEAGRQCLVVLFLRPVVIPFLGYHKDIVVVTGGLVRGVAVLVPLREQSDVGGIVVGVDTPADVLDGIQAKAVDAHIYPLVGRSGDVLEAGVVLDIGGRAVVQVGHPVAEATHIIEGFGGHVGKLDAVASGAGKAQVTSFSGQLNRLALSYFALSGLGPELGSRIPAHILPDQHPDASGDVRDQIKCAVALVDEAQGLSLLSVLPEPKIPVGAAGLDSLVGLRNGKLGGPGSHLFPLVSLVGRSLQHRERRVFGRRIGTEEIIVPIRAGRVGQGLLEPSVVLSAMVKDIVHIDTDALVVGRIDEVLEILLTAVQGVDRIVVVHVVGVVGGRGMGRGQPEGRHAQGVQVVEPLLYALEVPDAVPVAVGEGIDQELVGGR